MDDLDLDIKREFLLEADELIEELESTFLRLEQNPDEVGIMAHVFRLVHTVKGTAYSAGFEELGAFAHLFETLLNMLREGRMSVEPSIVDLLLRSNDQLRLYIKELKHDFDSKLCVAEISDELSRLIGDDMPKKWTGPVFGIFDDEVIKPQEVDDKSVDGPKKQIEKSQENVPVTDHLNGSLQILKLRSVQSPLILICDDEPELLEIVVGLIRLYLPASVQIATAADGQEALERIHTLRPHLIITDLKMPKLNGLEFIRALRETDKNVPVMVLSGQAGRDDMIEFIKLGVTDYLDKPIRNKIFEVRLQRLLHLAQIREAVERLSVLNFRAHMNSVKLLQIQKHIDGDVGPQRERVEKILEEIAVLTNFVLTM